MVDEKKAAAMLARDTLLFYHEMCRVVPESVRNAVHGIERAFGEPLSDIKTLDD